MEKFMKKCLELAGKGKGYTSPNPLVGCVIVKNGEVIAKGYHHKFGDKHAEIDALDKVNGKAEGTSLYVNLEPCCFFGKTPACTDRIIKEGIAKVIIGTRDPNPKVSGKGIEILKNSGIKIQEKIMEDDCRMLNQFYFKWIETGIPYITLKIARTSDGFVAKKDGTCPYITNKKSRTEVHRLRSWYDAVLVGRGTATVDKPSLTVRFIEGRQPLRIVLDTRGDLLKSSWYKKSKLFNDVYSKSTLWVVGEDTTHESGNDIDILKISTDSGDHLNLKELIKKLGSQNITSILVEGGPHIWQSFLDKNLVDQVLIFTAPQKMGEGLLALPRSNLKEIKYKKIKKFKFDEDSLMQGYINLY